MGTFIKGMHDWELESLIAFLNVLNSTKVRRTLDDKKLLNPSRYQDCKG